jgi:hypothetical protein
MKRKNKIYKQIFSILVFVLIASLNTGTYAFEQSKKVYLTPGSSSKKSDLINIKKGTVSELSIDIVNISNFERINYQVMKQGGFEPISSGTIYPGWSPQQFRTIVDGGKYYLLLQCIDGTNCTGNGIIKEE